MKYLAGILLLLLVQTASAGQCRVDGGPWILMDRRDNTMSITATVQATPGAGLIRLDGYTMECRYSPNPNEPRHYTDYWHTVDNSLIPGPKFSSSKMGLSISNSQYPVPVRSRIRIASMQNNGAGVNLHTYLYLSTQGTPGNPLSIRTGDLLGTLYLRQTNNTGAPSPPTLRIFISAGNDFIVKPSTCTINGDRPIDVNFGSVDQSRIGENPSSSAIQKIVRLTYSCPDRGVSMPVTITLKGLVSSFNPGVLRMSNPNLGVGLLRGGGLVGPERSFRTNIYNSTGADDVVFSLVRRTGSVPATGAFSGSATLVMGGP